MIASIVFVNHLHIGNRGMRIADRGTQRSHLWIDGEHVAQIKKTNQIMLIPKKALQLCIAIVIDRYRSISIESSTMGVCVSEKNYVCQVLRPIMNLNTWHNAAATAMAYLDPDRACAYRTVHQLRHVSTPSSQLAARSLTQFSMRQT